MADVRDDLCRPAGMPVTDRYEPARLEPDVRVGVRGAGVLLGTWCTGAETCSAQGRLDGRHSGRTAPAGAGIIVIAATAPP